MLFKSLFHRLAAFQTRKIAVSNFVRHSNIVARHGRVVHFQHRAVRSNRYIPICEQARQANYMLQADMFQGFDTGIATTSKAIYLYLGRTLMSNSHCPPELD